MEASDEFDTTALRYSNHALKIHRDYLAHVFRWGWATRYIGQKQHRRVLEPGCGADVPLALSLMRVPGTSFHPELYVGVDLNTIPYIKTRREGTGAAEKFQLKERFNFVERWRELWHEYGPTFDLTVSFEVIEHMTEEHGETYLKAINALMPVGGKLILSTPVFNGHAAQNHIREYTVEELEDKLARNGFAAVDRFGTFASFNDAVKGLRELDLEQQLQPVYDRCREFYGDEVMASFLAPLLPDHSRNNVWIRQKTFEPW